MPSTYALLNSMMNAVKSQLKACLPLPLIAGSWRLRMLDYYFWFYRRNSVATTASPKVIFMLGMPRTGSTLAKRYLGEHPDIEIAPYRRFATTLRLVNDQPPERIVVDKTTRNVDFVHQIHMNSSPDVWYLGIVRDPRDEYVSLAEGEYHPEVPTDRSFWPYWVVRYQRLLSSLAKIQDCGGSVRFVRYEDLTSDPVAVKTLWLEWLGLKATLVSPTYTPSESIRRGIDTTEDHKVHQTNAVHSGSQSRWRKQSGRNREIIEMCYRYPAAKRLMADFGYIEDGIIAPRLTKVRFLRRDD